MCSSLSINNGDRLDGTQELSDALKALGATGAVYIWEGVNSEPSIPCPENQCLCSLDTKRTIKQAAQELGMRYRIRFDPTFSDYIVKLLPRLPDALPEVEKE